MKRLSFVLLGLLLIALPCYSVTIETISGEIQAAPHNNNYTAVKSAIESFDGSQIQAGTVTNSALKSPLQLDSSSIEGGTTDVNLQVFASNYRAGVQCVYEAVGNITVTAGEIMINQKLRRNTSATDSAWTAASTTASGLDTGAEAASTLYYIYACADDPNATTFTIAISTNSSAPSYSGATNYRLIGRFYNDASSNINSVGNTGTDMQGLKCASGKTVATGASMTVNLGFQPIYVKVMEGDAAPAAGEAVIVDEITTDLDVDGFTLHTTAAAQTWQADTGTPGIQNLTTTGFTINTTNTYVYYWVAIGF